MSSLIEQAALRLEQLKRAGAKLPSDSVQGARLPGGGFSASGIAAGRIEEGRGSASPAAIPPGEAAPVQRSTTKIVEIDFEAMAANRLLVPGAARSTLSDQYRVVKRPLIRNAVGRDASKITHGNLIMVTSALAGEGKSFTALNLSMSIAAELDHTVMLVDADVARPSILGMLGLESRDGNASRQGLLDVLEGRAQIPDVLLRTNVDKLTILPSGALHERATELLASEAMSRLLQEMARRYPDRIIVFDSPPLLQTTEARVLATHMGQVVLVVRAGETGQSAVQDALATIESCPVRLLLLNCATSATEVSYGYGYGSGADTVIAAN